MKPNLLKPIFSFLAVLCFTAADAQSIDITANAGTSATPALGTSNYVANESIYTETEIGAGNFITAGTAITHIGLSPNTLGANTTFNSVSIYMKDVPTTTTTFTTGTYSTTGYTLVFSGSVAFSATGFTDIALTAPYTRTTGTNLQVLITRADNATHTSFIWNCANGNNTSATANTTRRYNGTTALSGTTSLAVSAFRQAVRLKHQYPNDATVNIIYTLAKLPIPNAAQQTISALVTNVGTNTLTNLPVTLNITGANTYSQSQTVASLVSGATTTVTFPATNFTSTGTNNVTVSVAADDYTVNDSKSLTQLANQNTWSYSEGTTSAGGVGFNGASGDFVAKFNTSIATSLTQVSVNFAAGGQPFKIGIWDATGTAGAPGALLWESATNASTAGIYVLPVTPAAAIPAGSFYVGVRQIGTANVSFAYQAEVPIRSNTFYYTSPSGGTAWNDFAPANPFRFMIEPKLIVPVDAGLSPLSFNGGSLALSCAGVAQNIFTTITNTGSTSIAPGAATVNLKVRGANTYNGAVANTTTIAAGGNEVITFSNVTFNTPGTNYDTVYVALAGDLEASNDTIKSTHSTQVTSTTFPVIESFETVPYAFSNVQQIAGTGNWTLQSGSVTNLDLPAPLASHSGGNFLLFNSYNFTAATSSMIYGNCFTIPALGSGNCNHPYLGFWMSHDASYPTNPDSVYVTISTNGGASWTQAGGYARYNVAYTTPGWSKETIDLSSYTGQTIMIGFQAISKFGNVIGIDDVLIGSLSLQNVGLATAASSNVNLQQTCDDAGWSYYADPLLPNVNVLAINWDPNSTNANTAAKAAAVPTITLDANAYAAENAGAQTATYTMRRYWNVNIGSNTLTSPVNVRFFYDSTEIAEVKTAANNFISANGGALEPPTWFKTVSGAFAPSPSQVNANGVVNAIPLTNANTTNGKINGIPYAQFNGVTSFSGGTFAAGVGTGTPLPIVAITISAKAAGNRNIVNWKMENTMNGGNFWLEKSTDGKTFSNLEMVAVQKDNTTYSAFDETPASGINYYRVKLIDRAGNSQYSNVVSLSNNDKTQLSVFPNPAKDVLNVKLFSDVDHIAVITLVDNLGRTVYQADAEIAKGTHTLTIPVKEFTSGTYMLNVNSDGKTYSNKVTID